MPKVSLKTPKKAQALTEAVDPKVKARKEAMEAVKAFKAKKTSWFNAQEEWAEKYSEANTALDEVKQLEDEVRSQVPVIVELVRACDESIEDFKLVHANSSPTFDGKKMLHALAKLDNEALGKAFKDFFERGLITSISVDASVALLLKDREPAIIAPIKNTWMPSVPLTSRVSAPKF